MAILFDANLPCLLCCLYQCMYIAQPLQPKQSRGAYRLDRTNEFLTGCRTVSVSVKSRSAGGKLFQSLGALTAKLQGPKVTVLVSVSYTHLTLPTKRIV